MERKIALAGNPNCGKTTLFNAYTGAKLKVANWPGVTVEKKEGALSYHKHDYKLVDLPGIYSLTSYTTFYGGNLPPFSTILPLPHYRSSCYQLRNGRYHQRNCFQPFQDFQF